MEDGFICDNCGFTSIEETGTGNTYYCPKCGNKMRIATQPGIVGGGDANPVSGVIALDILYLIFVGGFSFGVMNYIGYYTPDFVDIVLLIVWFVLFIISLVKFHKWISDGNRGKAVKK